MSVITFQCYACNQVLQVDADKAGRKAKCSQCSTLLTIPALTVDAVVEGVAAPLPAAPPPVSRPPDAAAGSGAAPPIRRREEDDDAPRRRDRYDDEGDDRPRRGRRDTYDDDDIRRSAEPNWDKVKIGFLLVFTGLCVMGGAFVFTVLGNVLGFVSFTGWRILSQIGFTIVFLGTIAAVVGHVFWLFVFSNKRGAMGFAIAALSVCGVYLLMQLITLIQVYGSIWGYSNVGWLLVNLLRAAHFMMIAFYLRTLALWLDDPRLQRSAMINVVLCGCLAGFDLLIGVILMALAPGMFVVGQIFGLLGGILVIVIYVFTLVAVHRGKLLVEARGAARASSAWSRDDDR